MRAAPQVPPTILLPNNFHEFSATFELAGDPRQEAEVDLIGMSDSFVYFFHLLSLVPFDGFDDVGGNVDDLLTLILWEQYTATSQRISQ